MIRRIVRERKFLLGTQEPRSSNGRNESERRLIISIFSSVCASMVWAQVTRPNS
ncbi:hypothetical protein LINPERHAP1_LOCUS25762 [Linum perenne]